MVKLEGRRILIVGTGIAGLTTALRLARGGIRPLVIERSPTRRLEGYMIDFCGAGYDVAEAMKLRSALEAIHYPIGRLAFLDEVGHERFSVDYSRLRHRVFQDRHFNFLRGDLERVLFDQVRNETEIRFGTSVASLSNGVESVHVSLTDGTEDEYDVVVGADGVHSALRHAIFPEDKRYLRDLGHETAAFIVHANALGDRLATVARSSAFFTLSARGRQVAVYPIRGGHLATFFLRRTNDPLPAPSNTASALERAYGDLAWIVPDILAALPHARDVYIDRVEQVELPRWHAGRVVLVGDACGCVSLLAGQGASLAMAEGFLLADELRATSVADALAQYEARLRDTVRSTQAAGRRIARWFVPTSRWARAWRDLFVRGSVWPGLAWFARREMLGASDAITAPLRAANAR